MKINMNSPSARHLCKVDKELGGLIHEIGEIEYHIHEDGYSFLVHEIIEQMLSVKVASKIYNKLISKCGGSINPTSIQTLAIDEILSAGVSKRKAKAIMELTDVMLSNKEFLNDIENCSPEEATRRLKSIYGIGTWTAKMYLIFVMNQEDVLPYEDGAFLQVYKWLYKTNDISSKSIIKRCDKWRPYSSIGARYMYRALDMGIITRNTLRE